MVNREQGIDSGASLMPRRSANQNLIRLLRRPSVRATAWFHLWQCLFAYTPREKMLDMAMEFAQKSALEGDYLEFGIFEGDMFAFSFHMSKRYSRDQMHFYAFDSFLGLPPTSGVDAAGFEHFKEGQYLCNEPEFLANLRQYRVDLNRVTTVPGWFDEVLNEKLRQSLPLRRAAIVWVDCDLYESAVAVLDFITDYLQEEPSLFLMTGLPFGETRPGGSSGHGASGWPLIRISNRWSGINLDGTAIRSLSSLRMNTVPASNWLSGPFAWA